MKRIPSIVWATLVFAVIYGFLEWGAAPLTETLTGIPAPLPRSLVLMYSGMAVLAILVYLSVQGEGWQEFKRPVVEFLRDSRPRSRLRRAARRLTFAAVPVVTGFWAWASAAAQPAPPADPPGIHFNLPDKYVRLKNPVPWTPDNIRKGGILYTRNCAMCHGDAQDGNGMFARAWQPRPANFHDSGTIAQLDENYLFWRIKEGGRGIKRGGGAIHYRSAMPVWDGVLTDEEIWQVIMFEYTNAGVKPAKR